jgi:MFS family permease
MVAGATLVAGRLPDRRLAPSILVSSVILGLAVATAAVIANVWIAISLFFVAGIGNGTGSVAIRSLIHHRAPDHIRGRVFAVYMGLATAGQLGATALGGVLVGGEGARAQQTLIIGGLGAFTVGVLGLLWFATVPGRVRSAPAPAIRIPDLEPGATGGIEVPIVLPERTVVEVRNITPDEQVVDLTGIELIALARHRNGSSPDPEPADHEDAARVQEPEMLPSSDPRA